AGGHGYANGDKVAVTGPNGSQFSGTAVVDANGAIIGVNITSTGSGFTGVITSVTVTSTAGTGANPAAPPGVVAVSVTNAGSGYANPTFTFSGGSGTGATAQAVAGGGANIVLSAPELLANAGSSQSVTTTGNLTINRGIGVAPALVASNIGGGLALTAASITDAGSIVARSGNVTLTAISGDIVLQPGASIDASGSHIAIRDIAEDTPGGAVQLSAVNGNVTIDGATVNVAGIGKGFGGTLSIFTSATGTATLNGTPAGGTAYNDLGGNFTLQAGNVVGSLPWSAFTGGFSVILGQGSILVPAGTTLTS